MDQTPPPNNVFRSEPAVIISTATALLTAVIGALVAFGLDISDEQQQAVISVVAPAVAVIALIGPIIRHFVYSPAKTQQLVDAAESAGQKGETAPVPPV